MQIEMQNAEALTEHLLVAQEYAGKGKRARGSGQGEEGAGRDPQVCMQGHAPQSSADDKADPQLPGDGDSRGEREHETTISGQVHRRGCATAGSGGQCARAAERSGDEVHSEAGVRRIRQSRIRKAGGDFGGAYLQPARQSEVPEGGGKLRANAPESGID